MQLYYAPDSIALVPHIALSESSLNYSLVRVDHHLHLNEDGSSYFEVNPNGYVPALKLSDGKIMTETLAILQYIADLAPQSNLLPPPGDGSRYRVLSWASYVATEIHQKFMRFTQPDLTTHQSQAIMALIKQRISFAEAQLSRSPYLEGANLTMANIFLYVASGWLKYHEVATSEWPHLERCRALIGQRPAVTKALAEEGLV
jgi:glutathione S-transferase